MIEEITLPDKIVSMLKLIESRGFEAYVVGGAVRDILLGKEPKDFDIFSNAPLEVLMELFPSHSIIGGSDRQNKMFTISVDGVEISKFRGNGERTEEGVTIEDHCKTCDFTINAIAVDSDGFVMDFMTGISDLQRGMLRFCGDAEQRISEDPLRLFRGIRFICKYKLSFLDFISLVRMSIMQGKLDDIPVERIREEFNKIIVLDRGFELLSTSGLLDWMIPEIETVIGLDGGAKHAEDVFTHMTVAGDYALKVTDDVVIVTSAYLHDVGKGICFQHNEESRISFKGHELESLNIVEKFLKRFKYSNEDSEKIKFLIGNHMKMHDDSLSKKSLARMFSDMEDSHLTITDCVIIQFADHQGNLLHDEIKFADFMANNHLFKSYISLKEEKVPFKIKDLAVNGHDLMKVGIPAGVEIGQMLNKILEKVLDGELENSQPEIIKFVKKTL